ncbi:MAG: hypothetical protein ABSF63_06305 [Candidatus Bathyarchaeia archaeon]
MPSTGLRYSKLICYGMLFLILFFAGPNHSPNNRLALSRTSTASALPKLIKPARDNGIMSDFLNWMLETFGNAPHYYGYYYYGYLPSNLPNVYATSSNFGTTATGSTSYPSTESGDSTKEGTVTTINTGAIRTLNKFTTSVPFTITSVTVYQEIAFSGHVQFGLYVDSSGSPESQAIVSGSDSGSLSASTSIGWETYTYSTPFYLAAGTYHLAYSSDTSETNAFYRNSGDTGTTFAATYTYTSSLPSKFPTTGFSSGLHGPISAYMTGVQIEGYSECTEATGVAGAGLTVSFYAEASGNYRLAIYTDSSGPTGSPVWSIGSTGVSGAPSLQTVNISSGSPTSYTFSAITYWLCWQVDTVNSVPAYISGSANTGAYEAQAYGVFPSGGYTVGEQGGAWANWTMYVTVNSTTTTTVTLPLEVCLQESGAALASFGLSGGSVTPASITAAPSSSCASDLTDLSITAGATLTVTVPTDGTYSRYRMNSTSTSFTTEHVTACSPAGSTCGTSVVDSYYEVGNTYAASANAQMYFDSGLTALTIMGTMNNTASATLCTITLTIATSDTCSSNRGGNGVVAWSDYGTTVSGFTNPLAGAPSNSRWEASGGSHCTFTPTSGDNTENCNYYKQWTNTYEMEVAGSVSAFTSGSGSGETATVLGYQYGSPSQTICSITVSSGSNATCTGYSDNAQDSTISQYLTGNATNTEWQNSQGGTQSFYYVTSGANTYTGSYYLQLKNTYQATPSTSWSGIFKITVTGTYLGVSSSTVCSVATTNGGSTVSCRGYADYSTQVSFPTSLNSGQWNEQGTYQFTDTTSNNTHTVTYAINACYVPVQTTSGTSYTDSQGSVSFPEITNFAVITVSTHLIQFNLTGTLALNSGAALNMTLAPTGSQSMEVSIIDSTQELYVTLGSVASSQWFPANNTLVIHSQTSTQWAYISASPTSTTTTTMTTSSISTTISSSSTTGTGTDTLTLTASGFGSDASTQFFATINSVQYTVGQAPITISLTGGKLITG